jgi:hypothetical protein
MWVPTDVAAVSPSDHEGMTDNALAKVRDTAARERYGLRRAERRMTAEEAELERILDAFKVDLTDSEHRLEAGYRRQHSGRDPESPFSWVAAGPPARESRQSS